MKMRRCFVLLGLLAACPSVGFAWTDVVVEKGGKLRECDVVEVDDEYVTVAHSGGREHLARVDVVAICLGTTAATVEPVAALLSRAATRTEGDLRGVTAEVVARLSGHTSRVRSVDFCSNGDFVVSGGFDWQCIVWDLARRKEVHVLKELLGDEAMQVSFLDKETLVVACRSQWANGFGNKHVAIVRDWGKEAERALLVPFAAPFTPSCFAVDGGRRFLVAGGEDGILRCLDMKRAMKQYGKWRSAKKGRAMWVDSDLVSVAQAAPSGVRCVVFDSDGLTVLAGLGSGELSRFDVDVGDGALTYRGSFGAPVVGGGVSLAHTKAVSALCFAQDGDSLITASLDGSLIQWDAGSGLAMARIVVEEGGVLAMAVDPSGDILAVGASDGAITFVDTETLTAVGRANGHTRAVTSLAFDEGGDRLVSGSDDNQVLVWAVSRSSGIAKK